MAKPGIRLSGKDCKCNAEPWQVGTHSYNPKSTLRSHLSGDTHGTNRVRPTHRLDISVRIGNDGWSHSANAARLSDASRPSPARPGLCDSRAKPLHSSGPRRDRTRFKGNGSALFHDSGRYRADEKGSVAPRYFRQVEEN